MVILLLRISIAIAFIYSAILAFLHPFVWITYFPGLLRAVLPDNGLINLFAIINIVIAGWLIWGKKLFLPSLIASVILAVGILFNLNLLNSFYPFIVVLCGCLSIAVISYPRVIRE